MPVTDLVSSPIHGRTPGSGAVGCGPTPADQGNADRGSIPTATPIPAARPIDVTAHVRVVLGDSVSFRGFGFSSHLAGHLLAIEEPERSPRRDIRIVLDWMEAAGLRP